MGTSDGSDFATYVDARWADLVGGLEDEGVPRDDARTAVAEVLLASRRSWSRRVRDEDVDVALWAEVRERAGLRPRPGTAAPHGVRPFDPNDAPEPWLTLAERARGARRREGARRAVAGLGVVALLAVAWSWWASRPDAPDVREEANTLPVVWYAAGELHLPDVVVELSPVDEFVASGSGAVVRMRSGELLEVAGDGAVSSIDRAPAALDDPPQVRSYEPPGRYDVSVQGVPLPGGGWAYLIDSSRRASSGDEVRQSESGRRALVVCTADGACDPPRTIEATGTIRLR